MISYVILEKAFSKVGKVPVKKQISSGAMVTYWVSPEEAKKYTKGATKRVAKVSDKEKISTGLREWQEKQIATDLPGFKIKSVYKTDKAASFYEFLLGKDLKGGYFHGTNLEHLKGIIKEGLTHQKFKNFENDMYEGERSKSVFVTNRVEDAFIFSQYALKILGSNLKYKETKKIESENPLIVFKIVVPKKWMNENRVKDTGILGFQEIKGAYALPYVRPKWIKKVFVSAQTKKSYLNIVAEFDVSPDLFDKIKSFQKVVSEQKQGDILVTPLAKGSSDLLWEKMQKSIKDYDTMYVPVSIHVFNIGVGDHIIRKARQVSVFRKPRKQKGEEEKKASRKANKGSRRSERMREMGQRRKGELEPAW